MHFEGKNNFFLYFRLIFVKAPSENVVAMETREALSVQFWFQNITYILSGKSQSLKKNLLSFGVMLPKPQSGVKPPPPSWGLLNEMNGSVNIDRAQSMDSWNFLGIPLSHQHKEVIPE